MTALCIVLYLFAGFFWALFVVAATNAIGSPLKHGWSALASGLIWPITLALFAIGFARGRQP